MSIAEAIQTPFDLYEKQYGEESYPYPLQDPDVLLQVLEERWQDVLQGRVMPIEEAFKRLKEKKFHQEG